MIPLHPAIFEAGNTVWRHPIMKSSTLDCTRIGEIGLRVKSPSSRPMSIDFDVQGHSGKREGVTGSFKVEYRF
jgi:hypothetical protein